MSLPKGAHPSRLATQRAHYIEPAGDALRQSEHYKAAYSALQTTVYRAGCTIAEFGSSPEKWPVCVPYGKWVW